MSSNALQKRPPHSIHTVLTRHPAGRGFVAGAVAGAATVTAMYLVGLLTGLQPLPQLLQQPLLDALPGPAFGFLIDNLQHLGKVIEEAGLIAGMVVALAAWGAVYGRVRSTREVPGLAMIMGGLAWAVTTLVLLPFSGDGLLGLNEGVAAPITWAVLYVTYAIILEAAYERWLARPASDDAVDPGRRQLLRMVPVLVGGGSLLLLGVRLLPGWYQSVVTPPESGLAGPSPEITPVSNFYVVSKNFSDPVVSEAGWTLEVKGLVQHPQRLSLSALRALPSSEETVTMECVSNNVGGPLMSTGVFSGVPLRDLLALAGPQASATTVAFNARDGYTESLPLSLVMGAPEILVVHSLAGAPLPDRHGFPARIITPGHYGVKSTKWLESIELVAGDRNGYWENQGWERNAIIKTTARIDIPRDGFLVKLGPIDIAGVAFAGTRRISTVEVSTDGGRNWLPATLRAPLSSLAWTLWSLTWTPDREGAYTLQVRARDGEGRLQAAATAPSYPDGASGFHTVRVNVTAK